MPLRNFSFTTLCALTFVTGCGGEFPHGEQPASTPAVTSDSGDPAAAVTPRKIIYTATFHLAVQDLQATDAGIRQLVVSADGYLANYRDSGQVGETRTGQWIVRLPHARFEAFKTELLQLGVPELQQIDSQDVTEQYVDLSARLKNKQQLEHRILALLAERTGEIKDVLEVESQLSRVREEIELLEGKLRYLSDRVALTTITISAREDRSFTPAHTLGFSGRAARTFRQSWHVMAKLAEGVALGVVALTPWAMLIILFVVPCLILFARRRRRHSG